MIEWTGDRQEPDDQQCCVTVALDMADADQVGEILAKAADAGKPLVRVRMSELRFADSSAIKAIMIGAKAADDRGVRFELLNPRGLVQRTLEVSGVTMALTVVQEPDRDQPSRPVPT